VVNTTDWNLFTSTLEELNLQVKERFDAERLEFAYPTQTLFLRQPSVPTQG
jgi:small-conductance mechanosensitive channel